jgi:ATP-dependent exoDNAse (exonuclease V) beta subunit
VPYIRQVSSHTESGVIDLIYRVGETWQVVDFKTDTIASDSERMQLIAQYSSQMRRYASAARQLLGVQPTVRLCFLDDCGQVTLVPFS